MLSLVLHQMYGEKKHYYEILIIRDILISVDFMDLLAYEIKNSAICNVSSYNTMKISINEKKWFHSAL